MEYKKITTIEELNAALDEGCTDFVMTNGIARSSKFITYGDNDGEYEIINLIDDSRQILTEAQLFDPAWSNSGTAMKNGAFFCEIDD